MVRGGSFEPIVEGATQLGLSPFETFEYVDAAANQAEVLIYRNLLFAEATHQAIEDEPLYIEEPRFLRFDPYATRRQLPVVTPPQKVAMSLCGSWRSASD
jgi:hypothetical protein